MLNPILIVGGAALDITATAYHSMHTILHTKTPGTIRQTSGGVGRNVCEAAMRTGATCILMTCTGDDLAGYTLRQDMDRLGMDVSLIDILPSQATAVYHAIHDSNGQLIAAVEDMDIFDSMDLRNFNDVFKQYRPSLVCFDGNITANAMETITFVCQSFGVPVFFEPTSVPKSLKLFEGSAQALLSGAIRYASPNQYELNAMVNLTKTQLPPPSLQFSVSASSSLLPTEAPILAHQCLDNALYLSHFIPHIILKLGEYGCVYVGLSNQQKPTVLYLAPEIMDVSTIKNATGAGDSLVGIILANLQKDPFIQDILLWKQIIQNGQRAAIRTLQSDLAVSPLIDQDLLL
ncbi:Ribokinase-like protein [Chlamydoabsidia padenii]|nr:Ribokinase-like protein [Chlamydoabsidia padenii]